MTTPDVPQPRPETNRDRVRRLLTGPLEDRGFRRSAKVPEDRHQTFLDRLADDLRHLTDRQLATLADMLAHQGEGKAHNIWPGMATCLGLAEIIAPRPIEDHPLILSWFGSRRGPEARAEGLHLAEFLFLERRKRPPMHDGERHAIRERAQAMARRAQLARERTARGTLDEHEAAWLRWHDALAARVDALIDRRGEDAA